MVDTDDLLFTRREGVAVVTVNRTHALNALAHGFGTHYMPGERPVPSLMAGRDSCQGVRAMIIENCRALHWPPPSLEAVSEAGVKIYFAPLGSREFDLPVV